MSLNVISASISQTGDFSSDRNFVKQAYQLWAGQVNAQAILLGRRIEKKFVNKGSSTQQVVTNYQTLIDSDSLRDRRLTERCLAEVTESFQIVAERGDDMAASLSGCQQVLVEFAQAMMLDPAVLLLGEPSMGLEAKIRLIVFETVRQLSSSGRTILLVEQNARSGLELADHGVVLETGRVRLEGTGAEILSHPHLGELYLGKRTPEVASAES